jgi:hypothetical protein
MRRGEVRPCGFSRAELGFNWAVVGLSWAQPDFWRSNTRSPVQLFNCSHERLSSGCCEPMAAEQGRLNGVVQFLAKLLNIQL